VPRVSCFSFRITRTFVSTKVAFMVLRPRPACSNDFSTAAESAPAADSGVKAASTAKRTDRIVVIKAPPWGLPARPAG
jgi:hypothetical protein